MESVRNSLSLSLQESSLINKGAYSKRVAALKIVTTALAILTSASLLTGGIVLSFLGLFPPVGFAILIAGAVLSVVVMIALAAKALHKREQIHTHELPIYSHKSLDLDPVARKLVVLETTNQSLQKENARLREQEQKLLSLLRSEVLEEIRKNNNRERANALLIKAIQICCDPRKPRQK